MYVNDTPLIFYHFSGFTLVTENEFNLCWYYHIDDEATVNMIYVPYIKNVKNGLMKFKSISRFQRRVYSEICGS